MLALPIVSRGARRQGRGRGALAAQGRSPILDRCGPRDPPAAGNPAQDPLEDPIMNTISDLSFGSHGNAFDRGLSLDVVRTRAPAVFASGADERLSSKYTFLPTERILTGLMRAGFVPVDARQASARRGSALHARHVVRLRPRFQTVALKDSVPEVVFLNSHDGSSAYQLRMGLFRVVCTNGLIVSRGAFPAFCVSHRGNIVDDVVAGALKLAERFDGLAEQVERMEQRQLFKDEQLAFAEAALRLRFPEPAESGMQPAQLLACRRSEDVGDDLWRVYNRCQEHLLRGGLSRRSITGRLTRTRAIGSIRRDVALNGQLWDLAVQRLAA